MALFEGRYDATTRTLADGEVAPIALTSAGLVKTDAVGGGGGGGAVTIANGDAVPLGSTTGAAVITDANGTIQQYLRGLVTRWANALGAGTAAAALRVTLASDGPGVAALGAITGAAVVTDADGSIQQYGRGNIVLALSRNTKLDTANTSLALMDDAGVGEYETVAASQTTQALGATGATGDYLSGVLIIPGTTSPGAVAIKDGANGAITVFTGGASSVSNLVPFMVPLGIRSAAGAWQVTTGANVTAIGVGNFT